MPGPLPKDPDARRRRNPATIPTTQLPAGGREGDSPEPPEWIPLGDAALAWWDWAWHTPQAAAWDNGAHVFICRRAQLEDDLDALRSWDSVTGDDLGELLGLGGVEQERKLRSLVSVLKAMAARKSSLIREAREIDDRLGLTPKAMAALRWKIVGAKLEPAVGPGLAPVVEADRFRSLG